MIFKINFSRQRCSTGRERKKKERREREREREEEMQKCVHVNLLGVSSIHLKNHLAPRYDSANLHHISCVFVYVCKIGVCNVCFETSLIGLDLICLTAVLGMTHWHTHPPSHTHIHPHNYIYTCIHTYTNTYITYIPTYFTHMHANKLKLTNIHLHTTCMTYILIRS